MEAVASMALKRLLYVAASCFFRMVFTTAFFVFSASDVYIFLRLEIINMEAQNVFVFNGMGDGIAV